MKVLFVEGRYSGDINLPKELIDSLPKKILLFTTVQYLDLVEQVKEQLKDKQILNDEIEFLPHSKYKYQVLGCGIKKIDINFDAFLYLGDGLFHPIALVIKNDKPCFCYNPFEDKFFVIDKKYVEKTLKKQRGAFLKFLESKNIGILFSIKFGQRWNNRDVKLLETRFEDKNFYYLISDEISPHKLQDFNFIDVFVNTACPRIAFDDYNSFPKPVINISELIDLLQLKE